MTCGLDGVSMWAVCQCVDSMWIQDTVELCRMRGGVTLQSYYAILISPPLITQVRTIIHSGVPAGTVATLSSRDEWANLDDKIVPNCPR